MKFELVSTAEQLAELMDDIGDVTEVIVDTEFMRRDTFYPQAALVQLCFPNRPDTAWLLDPLTITDFEPLRELFNNEDVIKVLHSASEDLEVFQKLLGCQPLPLFDSQRAAAFAGLGFGLGYRALVEAMSGISIDKEETRSDWLARPLSERQLAYAAADVIPLLDVYRQLRARLEESGRLEWVLEDGALAAAAVTASGPPSYHRIKTAWKLPPRKLGVLQSLCDWREYRAREVDKPRSWILSDQACMLLAQRCPESFNELRDIPEIPPSVMRKQGEVLLELVGQALAAAETDLPPSMPRPLDQEQRSQLKKIKKAAGDIARRWEVEPAALLPARDYELMVRLACGEEVETPGSWSGWRRAEIVEPLLGLLGVEGHS